MSEDQTENKEDRRERLSSLSTSEEYIPSGQGYSRFIKSLRIILPLFALGIIGLLFTWTTDTKTPLPLENIPKSAPEEQTAFFPETDLTSEDVENELVSPDFNSKTRNGTPYSLTAERATQKNNQPDLVYLESLRGVLEQAPPVFLQAEEGTYHQKDQFLTLNQNVVIRQEERGTLYLNSLEADLNVGEAFSPHPVRAESTNGTLTGKTLKITNQGDRIIVSGPAKIVLTKGFDTWND